MKEEKNKIPTHVAIIMDGNGRWAQRRGWPRIRGHQEGAESVRAVLRACKKAGVKYLTLYAFSTENWIRPKAEVSGLMKLLAKFLKEQARELHDNQVRLRTIGHIQDLPKSLQQELQKVKEETAHYTEGTLTLALSYGGRVELTDAVKQIAERVRDGALKPDDITAQTISEALYAPDIPDPDLMIRTSGEMRISNFLLWQLAYSEFYITDVLWPEFREAEFMQALEEYARRHRRFGNIK